MFFNKTQNNSIFDRMLNLTIDSLTKIIVLVGVLENLFTFSIYCILGIKPMIIITFVGIAVFIFCAFYLRLKSLSQVFVLILAYTIIAVTVSITQTEWKFGFQNYLFTAIPICIAFVYRNQNFKTVLRYASITLFLVSITYIGNHLLSMYLMPTTGSTNNFMMFVNIVNALFVILLNYVVFLRLLSDLFKDSSSLKEANNKLHNQADRDFLTNLYNRRFAERKLEYIKTNSISSCHLILIDIDYFKSFNDNYGHIVGDEILEHISRIIVGNLNHLDYAIRWGGEEFLIIVSSDDINIAKKIIERIMNQIKEVPYINEYGVLDVTITSGITKFDPKVDTVEDAISIADRRLYIGKNSGRNRYIING